MSYDGYTGDRGWTLADKARVDAYNAAKNARLSETFEAADSTPDKDGLRFLGTVVEEVQGEMTVQAVMFKPFGEETNVTSANRFNWLVSGRCAADAAIRDNSAAWAAARDAVNTRKQVMGLQAR